MEDRIYKFQIVQVFKIAGIIWDKIEKTNLVWYKIEYYLIFSICPFFFGYAHILKIWF